MIIPIKCFTCNKVIADKYRYFQDKVRERKIAAGKDVSKIVYLTQTNVDKTIEGEVMDELGINWCCRRHFMCHVDID
jgi:DNA-directed RNA polymerase subunit N (RpoN/RPB10)